MQSGLFRELPNDILLEILQNVDPADVDAMDPDWRVRFVVPIKAVLNERGISGLQQLGPSVLLLAISCEEISGRNKRKWIEMGHHGEIRTAAQSDQDSGQLLINLIRAGSPDPKIRDYLNENKAALQQRLGFEFAEALDQFFPSPQVFSRGCAQ